MSSLKLKHSGGNSVSLNPPSSAPTSSEVAFKLPNADGSANQVIKTDGSGNLAFAGYAEPPSFKAYLGSQQILANNTNTAMVMDTEVFDSNSFFNTSDYKFTPTIAGYYFIHASLEHSQSTLNYLTATHIYKNGSLALRGAQWNDGSNSNLNHAISGILAFNGSSDYAQVYAYQNSGGNITIYAGSGTSYFEAFYLRGL